MSGAVPTRRSTPASRMQQLQRSIGNRAVAGLVESATVRAETKMPVTDSGDRANAEAVSRRLDPTIRRDMEARFEHDFSHVRIHANDEAARRSAANNSAAYAVGSEIFFGAARYEPDTAEGRALLAHELVHVVQSENARAHPLRPQSPRGELEREAARVSTTIDTVAPLPPIEGVTHGLSPLMAPLPPASEDVPTFGNLPEDMPNPAVRRIVLEQEGDVWYEVRSKSERWRATGTYAFVIQAGKVWAVKPRDAQGANVGHTEAAAGGRVEYAGLVTFGSAKNQRGIIRDWTNASGHYLPVREFMDVAVKAGFPDDARFKAFEGPRPPTGPQAQLPVFQEPRGSQLTPKKADSTHRQTPQASAGQPPPVPAASAPPRSTPPQAAPTSPPPQARVPPSSAPPQSTPRPTPPPSSPAATAKPPSTTPPPPAAASPRPMPAVGQQFQTPSNALVSAEQRASAKGGAMIMALQGYGELARAIGQSIQRSDAESAFRASEAEILKYLQQNPGMGVMAEFLFDRTVPHPDSVVRPADTFLLFTWYPAANPTIRQSGYYPATPHGVPLWERRWIPPVRPAPQTNEGRRDTRVPVVIQKVEHLTAFVSALRGQQRISATATAIAFAAAKMTFSTAVVDFGGELLEMTANIYSVAIPQIEREATDAMTRRFNELADALQYHRGRYEQYRSEGWFTRLIQQRDFELPPPKMLDNAGESLRSGRDAVGRKDFVGARRNLREGNDAVRKTEFVLYHYAHGQRHWLEDEG
jgi:hypothetical protein